MNTEVKDMLNNARKEALERTRGFLETYYNKELVNAAIEFALEKSNQVGRRSITDESTYKILIGYINDCISGNKEIDKEEFDCRREMFESFMDSIHTDDTAFTFVKAATWMQSHPEASTRPEVAATYRKNKDFAVVFNFGDNDFGGYIEEAAKNFCDEYNRLLDQMDIYTKHSDCDMMINSYIKDLEFMENPDVLKETIKSLFIGSYMSNAADRIRLSYSDGSIPFMQPRVDKALDYIDYLGFNNPEKWWIGSKEVFENAKPEFECMQYDEVKDKSFDNYWLNGEVLLMYMEDNELKYQVR